jgi:uncharacterized protein YjdB
MPGSRRLLLSSAALVLGALTSGCLDDTSSAPLERSSPASLLLHASADIGAAVDRDVGVRVYYIRGTTQVDLPSEPRRFRVTGGETRREAVTVQLAPCLADPEREDAATPGCRLEVEVRLLDGDNTLDVAVSRPPGTASPGQAVEVPSIALAEVASVTIPAVPTLRVQDTRALTAAALAPGGAPIAGRTFAWASSNAAIVSVSQTGAITALAPGTATITAATGVRSGTVAVRVLARVASVAVTPPTPTVAAGTTVQLTPVARDAAGAALALAERTLTWASSAPAVAAVDANGLVTGMRGGAAQITATVDGVPGATTVTVTVSPLTVTAPSAPILVGRSAQLQAEGAVGAVAWTSSDPSVATVSATGLVTAVYPGTATIGATTPAGQSASVVVSTQVQSTSVSRATLESVSGSTPSISGYTFSLTGFTAFDADGRAIPGVVPVWSVSSGSSALAVTSGGVATGGAGRGSATLVARDARTGAVLRTDSYVVLNPVGTSGNGAFFADSGQTVIEETENSSGGITFVVFDAAGAPQGNRILRVAFSTAQTVMTAPARVRTGANGRATVAYVIGDVPSSFPSPYTFNVLVSIEGDSRPELTIPVQIYHGTFLDRRNAVTP